MKAKRATKTGKKIADLPAGRTPAAQSGSVRGGARDAAAGLPTGKRMHKP